MSIGSIGRIGEETRINQLQAKATPAFNLNSLKGFDKAQNAPAFDLVSKDGFESVKTTDNVNMAINTLLDIQSDADWQTSAMKINGDRLAKHISDNREAIQKDGAWPDKLPLDASETAIRDAMREGKIAVPDGVAEQVRAALPAIVRANPSFCGVKVDKSSPDFEQAVTDRATELASRVENFGKTALQCAQEAASNVRAVVATVTNSISNLSLPQPTDVNPAPVEPANPPSHSTVTPPPQPSPLFGPSGGDPH
jgi:hypothetical protein